MSLKCFISKNGLMQDAKPHLGKQRRNYANKFPYCSGSTIRLQRTERPRHTGCFKTVRQIYTFNFFNKCKL